MYSVQQATADNLFLGQDAGCHQALNLGATQGEFTSFRFANRLDPDVGISGRLKRLNPGEASLRTSPHNLRDKPERVVTQQPTNKFAESWLQAWLGEIRIY